MHAKQRPSMKSFWRRSWLIQMLLIAMSMRVGEASHPGPDVIHVGSLNCSGARRKAALISQLPAPGVWGTSETHLSCRGLHQFRSELAHQKPAMTITPGAPAPLRSQSVHTTGGKACGVAVLSTEPTRPLPHSFPHEMFAAARMQATVTHWQDDWIVGGVMYGFSAGSQTLAVQAQTNEMLAQLVTRIADQSVGKRFLCGDWNQPPHVLEATRALREKGWMEAQDFAQLKWGTPPKPTCITGNRIDYLWLSPELLPHVTEVQVQNVGFPDHFGLWVTCSSWKNEPPTPFWRTPAPIPWHTLVPKMKQADKTLSEFFQEVPMPLTNLQHESDAQYLNLAMELETTVQRALHAVGEPPLRSHQKGRAKTIAATFRCKRPGPLKASRSPSTGHSGQKVASKSCFQITQAAMNESISLR